MPKIFISHSSKDAFATEVRDRVFRRLQAISGIEPLLDAQCIEGAEEWRPKLLHWLGLCQGAVILFSRAALASPWVFTEATVLTWRRSQNPKLRLVPALLGDVQSSETRLDAFKPVKLQEIQFVRLDSVAETPDNAEKLAEKIAACFQGFTYNEEDPAMTEWLEDVQICLEGAHHIHLERAARVLGVCQPYWAEFTTDLVRNLSYQLLHTNLAAAYNCLRAAMESIYLRDRRQKLVEKVIPIWVQLAAARHIIPVLQDADYRSRNLALNTLRQDTAVHYLQRATCCTNRLKIINASEITGASPQEMLEQFERAMIQGAGYTRLKDLPRATVIERIIKQAEQSGDIWVVLFGEAAIRQGLPDLLRERYKGMTFILLCGSDFPPQPLTKLPMLELIEPQLNAAEEQEAVFLIEDLRNLIQSASQGGDDSDA
jgi:TIR domain